MSRVLAGFMAATAFVNMWINNSATTVMMLPMAMSVVGLFATRLGTDENSKEGVRLEYAAKSWDRPRTVIAKAEHTEKGANPRFILTSLEGAEQRIYDEIYCAGGEMENRIKEQQLGLFADRTSCQGWWANQFRLLFSSAYPHQQLFATILGRLSSA